MLKRDGPGILNEANARGVNQNRICFTYQRLHAPIRWLGSARAEACCDSSINREASALPVGVSARAEHRVPRPEIYSKHFARTGSLALAGIKIPPRFETMSERIHHGDSTTSAPYPTSSTLLFLQFVRSVFFFHCLFLSLPCFPLVYCSEFHSKHTAGD